jgi:hypothetical protein
LLEKITYIVSILMFKEIRRQIQGVDNVREKLGSIDLCSDVVEIRWLKKYID